jgi:hypothetical protein
MAVAGGVRIGVTRAGELATETFASRSRELLDRPLAGQAELWVTIASDAALVLGAFQRGTSVSAVAMPAADTLPVMRRASGGPEVHVGKGTVHVALALERPDALEPCDERRIVNRYVRPLLRALTKTAGLAHFFGRDWISVAHRPAAWVGFAHDAASKRTLVEAFVGVHEPFATEPRGSLLGKTPGALEELAGKPIDPSRVADAIVASYLARYDATEVPVKAEADSADASGTRRTIEDPRRDPPWAATVEEPIGIVGAGPDARGVMRVGGDLLVSRDALAQLESLVAGARDEEVGRIVQETLGGPGVAIDGVRSLASVRDVILRARRS